MSKPDAVQTPLVDVIALRLTGRKDLFCDDSSLAQYNDLLRLARTLEQSHASLLAALKAVMVMWHSGECPKKLDEALSWRECDLKAESMARTAIAQAEAIPLRDE